MNKTLKRRVFRHTALYAAILMFSHTGGGGGGAGGNPKLRFCHKQKKTTEGKKEGLIFTLKGKKKETKIYLK
ncbi:pilus-associated protein, partial [Neisseria meningitidis]|nr:pilus-associated protein [Neisseria meningitidis]